MKKHITLILIFAIFLLPYSAASDISSEKEHSFDNDLSRTKNKTDEDVISSSEQKNLEEKRIIEHDRIVVTGKRNTITEVSSVDKVDEKKIKETGSVTISDAVKHLPSVNVMLGSRGEEKITLRGFDQRKILLLMDGVPVYDPYNGIIDLGKFPSEIVSEIILTKGVSSVIYGPNSMGGIINLITKKNLPSNLLKISSELSFYDTTEILNQRHSITYATNTDTFNLVLLANLLYIQGFKLSDSYEREPNEDGGKRENSYKTEKSFLLNAGYNLENEHKLRFLFNFIDGDFGVPPDTNAVEPKYWKFTDWNKLSLALSDTYFISSNLSVIGKIFFDLYENALWSYDDPAYLVQTTTDANGNLTAVGNSFQSIYNDISTGINLYPTYEIDRHHRLKMGLNFKKDIHKSTEQITRTKKHREAETYSFGIEDEIDITKKFSAVAGIGLNYLSGRKTTFDFTAGMSYLFDNTGKVYLSAGRKTRFPTLKEMYSTQNGVVTPNKDLKAERSINLEAGFRMIPNKIDYLKKFDAAFFTSYLDNLIDRVYVNNITMWDNIASARYTGVEVSTEVVPAKNLSIEAKYMYMQAVNTSSNTEFERLNYKPESKIGIAVRYFPLQYMKLNTFFTAVFDQYYQLSTLLPFEKLRDYYLLDIRAGYLFKNGIEVYIMSKNLFDYYYETKYGFPSEGRKYIAGGTISF